MANIMESKNLDIINHQVILCLINYKWKKFARLISYIDVVFTFLNALVWILLGVLVKYDQRHLYEFPKDGWRVFLFVIGIVFTMILLTREILEVVAGHKYNKATNEQRKRELDEDHKNSHKKEDEKLRFIQEERRLLRSINAFKTYITDFWNIYDLATIVILTACIVTHIIDIVNHDEEISKAHNRLLSVTVIIITMRLLKTGRIVNERFGILVMSLIHVIYDLATWATVFILFWIPYASSFWMIFGGPRYANDADEADCKINPSSQDCTQIQVEYMSDFGSVLFQLYRTTLGQDYDQAKMDSIDPVMTVILTGTYIGFTVLLLINIFIAMLSSTFQRLYDNSKANMYLQRALEIMSIEQMLRLLPRELFMKFHYDFIQKCNPYKDKRYDEKLFMAINDDGNNSEVKKRLDNIEASVKELNLRLNNIGITQAFDNSRILTQFQFKKEIDALDLKIENLQIMLQSVLERNINRETEYSKNNTFTQKASRTDIYSIPVSASHINVKESV